MDNVESLTREIEEYRTNLERFSTILEIHREELQKIDTQLELARKQRKYVRRNIKKLKESRRSRGETEQTPVEEKFHQDLTSLNERLEQLDFRFEEQAEMVEHAKKEYLIEKKEILPKIDALEKKRASLQD